MIQIEELIRIIKNDKNELKNIDLNEKIDSVEELKYKMQLAYCKGWLKEQKVRKTINKHAVDCWLKHNVENWLRKTGRLYMYISINAIREAVIELGIPHKFGFGGMSVAIKVD